MRKNNLFKMKLLKEQEFEDSLVVYSNQEECPLLAFAKELSGLEDVHISHNGQRHTLFVPGDFSWEEHVLPRWAEEFVVRWDSK